MTPNDGLLTIIGELRVQIADRDQAIAALHEQIRVMADEAREARETPTD